MLFWLIYYSVVENKSSNRVSFTVKTVIYTITHTLYMTIYIGLFFTIKYSYGISLQNFNFLWKILYLQLNNKLAVIATLNIYSTHMHMCTHTHIHIHLYVHIYIRMYMYKILSNIYTSIRQHTNFSSPHHLYTNTN